MFVLVLKKMVGNNMKPQACTLAAAVGAEKPTINFNVISSRIEGKEK